MQFLTDCQADVTLDLVYRACLWHLLEPMELIKDLQPGRVLDIGSDCNGPPEDIAAWYAIGIKPEEDQGLMTFTLKRDNQEEEVHCVLSYLTPALENVRLSLRSGGRKWPRPLEI
jgi:TusA-related sulfurtransferase